MYSLQQSCEVATIISILQTRNLILRLNNCLWITQQWAQFQPSSTWLQCQTRLFSDRPFQNRAYNHANNDMLSWLCVVCPNLCSGQSGVSFLLVLERDISVSAKGTGEWYSDSPSWNTPWRDEILQMELLVVSWVSFLVFPGALGSPSAPALDSEASSFAQTSGNQSESLKWQMSALIHTGRTWEKQLSFCSYHKCLKNQQHEWASVQAHSVWHLDDLASSELPFLSFWYIAWRVWSPFFCWHCRLDQPADDTAR